ncbi:MAG: putative bacteriophage circulation protein Mu-like protein [Herminiimonas sp.]|nr:putative bacteriophage circulation protein Mu-like protein [Herminiimonas sp.]
MSTNGILSGVQSITTSISSGVNTVIRTAADLGLGTVGGSQATWLDQLKPASFRGVPFGVLDGESRFGRKNVVHEYPYRDQPWVEDLGKSARAIAITGFLVGDDVIAQRDRMIAAAESSVDLSLLVHPTYGQLKVNLVGSLIVSETWDRGRVFEIKFSFIESGERLFPSVSTFTSSAIEAAADAADAAAAGDFLTKAKASLKLGAAVVQQVAGTAAMWGRKVQNLVNDATNLANTVSTLKGGFGRFSGGRTVGGVIAAVSVARAASGGATVQSLIASGAAARTGASSAVSTLSSVASSLSGL